jgi:CHRD domain/Bacterial Ig domain
MSDSHKATFNSVKGKGMTSLKSRLIWLQMLLVLLCLPAPALSALNAVSTDGGGATLLNIANGFPLWYEDGNNTKLELCLQQQVVSQTDGVTAFRPCLTAEPVITRPISFPTNFGSEAFYYLLENASTFTDSNGTIGTLLLVMGLEAGFTNGLIFDGTQTVFNRVRIRADVPVPGTYRVTYPLGTFDYVVQVAGQGVRAINQTQDVGDFILPVDFTEALADGPSPAAGAPVDPAISEGIINQTGISISTFLGPQSAPPLIDTNGNLYLAEAGLELTPVLNSIEPGIDGVDFFSIELLQLADGTLPDPVTGFNGYFLNGADNTQVVSLTNFVISGKIFNEGNNVAPVALPDSATTSPGVGILIDVLPNDSDTSDLDPANPTSGSALNVHGLNRQALGIIDGSNILIAATHTTANGATVRRTIDVPNGLARFFYSPPATFAGVDSFEYVVQDTGGLFSAPTTVTVTVEDLQASRAEFRPRTGKWKIAGTSSDVTANTITATNGPKAYLTGARVIPSVVATSADATTALRVNRDSAAYQFAVVTPPTSEITEINLHVGDPASNGPVIFNLYHSLFDPPISEPLSGDLSSANMVSQPGAGVVTFNDAVREILAGNVYVSVLTVDNPDGEIRGQLQNSAIGSALVQPDGSWSIQGRAMTLPAGALPSVNLSSSNNIVTPGIPVQFR